MTHENIRLHQEWTLGKPKSEATFAESGGYMCYVVNKNTNYEHEVIGIYDSIEKAREHLEKAGMSAWITEHKMNAPGCGMMISQCDCWHTVNGGM